MEITIAMESLANEGRSVKNTRKPWTYKGVCIFPAEMNSFGIRWYAYNGTGTCLRADTKVNMRDLITNHS